MIYRDIHMKKQFAFLISVLIVVTATSLKAQQPDSSHALPFLARDLTTNLAGPISLYGDIEIAQRHSIHFGGSIWSGVDSYWLGFSSEQFIVDYRFYPAIQENNRPCSQFFLSPYVKYFHLSRDESGSGLFSYSPAMDDEYVFTGMSVGYKFVSSKHFMMTLFAGGGVAVYHQLIKNAKYPAEKGDIRIGIEIGFRHDLNS